MPRRVRHNGDMPLDAPDLLKERAHFSRAEARELGKSLRRVVARSELAEHRPTTRDPVAHLREQNATRVPELVPVRMAAHARESVRVLPGDGRSDGARPRTRPALGHPCRRRAATRTSATSASSPRPSGSSCSTSNDFDEAAVAPWEWDVKRLITSVIVGGREAGYAKKDVEQIAHRTFAQYVAVLRRMVRLSPSGRYFMHLNVESARRQLSSDGRRVLNAALAAAERRTSGRAIRRTTEREPDGKLRFVENPPTMVRFHLDEATPVAGAERAESIHALFAAYRDTVTIDIDTRARAVRADRPGASRRRRGQRRHALLPAAAAGRRRGCCCCSRSRRPASPCCRSTVASRSRRASPRESPHTGRVPRGGHAAGAAGRLRPVPRPPRGEWPRVLRSPVPRHEGLGRTRRPRRWTPSATTSSRAGACWGARTRRARPPGRCSGTSGRRMRHPTAIVTWATAYADQSHRDFETASAATW